jgi:antirestriction protein ArdC
MRQLAASIAKLSDEQRAKLIAEHPIVTIAGRVLSPVNQCMIASQNPTATIVGGFRQWLDAGRAVRKGEHGAAIWVPVGAGKQKEGEERAEAIADDSQGVRFVLGTVFDIQQTDEAEKGAN